MQDKLGGERGVVRMFLRGTMDIPAWLCLATCLSGKSFTGLLSLSFLK